MKYSVFLFLFFLLSITINVFSQVNSVNNTTICTDDFSKTLVQQQLSGIDGIIEPEKKIKSLTKIAKFFWDFDKEQSADYFREAYKLAEEDFFERNKKRKKYQYIQDHRSLVLTEVAKKDNKLSNELRKKYLSNIEDKMNSRKTNNFGKYREIQSTLFIVAEIAKSNPEFAIKMGQEVTKYELSNAWYFGLYYIAAKNQSVSDALFTDVLSKHTNTDVFRLLYLSAYPFVSERIFGVEKNSLGMTIDESIMPNPALQKAFLNVLLDKILKLTPEDSGKSIQTAFPNTSIAISALRDFEPLIPQFPEIRSKFYQAKTHAISLISNEMLDNLDKRIELNKSFNSSVRDKIDNLKKLESDGKLTDAAIFSVMFGLKEEIHFEEMKPWLIKIVDSKAREAAEQYFYYKRTTVAVDEERLDDARKYSEKVTGFIYKANLKFEIAQAEIKSKKDRYTTDKLLSDVFISANKADDSAEKAQVFFGLAKLYADFDELQSTQALNKAIEITNKLENPDIFKSHLQVAVKMKMAQFYTSYQTVGLNMEEVFRKVSNKNFSQAIGQAQSFSDSYFRTIAVIASVNKCRKNIAKEKVVN